MIETKIINDFPVIIHHRVQGPTREKEAAAGVADALSVAQRIVSDGKKLYVILDMRGYGFENIESHKIWVNGFLRHSFLTENVGRVAIVGDSGPQFFAEKEMFETDELRFFTDYEIGLKCLRDQEIEVPEQLRTVPNH